MRFIQHYSKFPGLNLLMDMLKSPNVNQKGDASAALHNLAAKAHTSVVSLFELPPRSPNQQVLYSSLVGLSTFSLTFSLS